MIKNYLEHISYPDYDEYDPDEIIELVGLPSGVFFETKRKNYSKIQRIANWSERLNTYTFRDKDYSKILYLLDLDENVIDLSNDNYILSQLKKIGIKNDFIKNENGITIYGDIELNYQKYQVLKLFAIYHIMEMLRQYFYNIQIIVNHYIQNN